MISLQFEGVESGWSQNCGTPTNDRSLVIAHRLVVSQFKSASPITFPWVRQAMTSQISRTFHRVSVLELYLSYPPPSELT